MKKEKKESPLEIIELRKTVDSINALKSQSILILESQGDNKKIDKENLFSIQQKICPKSLKNEYLKDFMKEKSIKSYVDVNVIELMKFFNQKTNM